MSENQDRGIRDFSQYDTMATEELEEILRFDTDAPEGEDTDVDVMLYVLEVLADRRRNNVEVTGKTALEAFEAFKQDYLPEGIHIDSAPEEKKPMIRPARWLRGLTAAAAVLAFVFLGAVTANALGFNIWKAVAVWAQETFRLEGEIKAESELPEVDISREYHSLESAIFDSERVHGIVPTWIPEGYELVELIVDENPLQKIYIAYYERGESFLKISVRSYQNSYPEQIEQSGDTEETYVSSNIIYHIFEDNGQLRAVWVNDSYECYITGDLTTDQLESMIDSIVKG